MKTKIENAYIIDGTNKSGYMGEIYIEKGIIQEVEKHIDGVFDKVIDAEGRVVSPGFIDTHSHSDLKVLVDNYISPKIHQGITTEILGQDGISMAPLPIQYVDDWRKNIAGLDGESDSINWNYITTDGYLSELEYNGLITNAAYLAPHGNIRMEAMGLSNKKAKTKDIELMKDILQRELDAGAIGLSSGLIYIPCAYGDLKELIELNKVVAKNNGIFVVHQRSEANTIIDSMKEIIEIGRQSGVKIHFSHFKICGKNNWNKADEILKLLDDAKKEGIAVSFDQYPYTAGSTMLSVILPPWAHAGGTNKLMARLQDHKARKKIIKDILKTNCKWDNFVEFAGLDGIYITSVKTEKNKIVIGKNLIELGAIKQKKPLEATLDLLLEEENSVGMIDYYGSEENVVAFLKREEQNVCTDGLLGGKPHPRAYGAFPRVIYEYVMNQEVLKLEEAIYKMTGKPAEVFQLDKRGKIAPGYWADIVIFEKSEIKDMGTYLEPDQYPIGIKMVIVNGTVVLEDNMEYRIASGKCLRKNNKKT
ncbi:N-acyl-D-amino-acid deacylase [Natranaerovirga hydrolytica]|uniref:N-acyl-D-amino-acid deacylase n=1 Tax=Natranaerovirga hydrolytica TaxID=680378 RepID=A0A4R1MYR7_9FIRM|nr:D-aminoacylase [Natranaerovirga hydrolytica]TCK97750.1 N-acyl-D-amino-acid deacylase [Natranaerovirga hydrolytica]